VYVIVLSLVVVMVPRALPVAVQTELAFEAAARLHVTAVLLVPVTAAVYCTVLWVVAVLTGTEAGEATEELTVTRICGGGPPLPGACAMHPASGNTPAITTTLKIRLQQHGMEVRTGASFA
jgi:hypothetical protein